MTFSKTGLSMATAGALLTLSVNAAVADGIPIRILDDMTGATASLGIEFAAAKADAIAYINENGGINGKPLKTETVDYAYKAPVAIATYKKWMSASEKPVLIYGYGTADTEALTPMITVDKIPFFSASFSSKLSDPKGASGNVERGTPFNFVHGPTYPDACRGVVAWAKKDWEAQGKTGAPKITYMADNYPSMMGYRDTCMEGASELGFEVLPNILYSLKPGDFKAQCLTLNESGADYAFLANPGDSTVALLKSCHTVGVKTRFLGGFYSYSEISMKAAGPAADGFVLPLHVTPYGTDVPGMDLVRKITKDQPHSTYYMSVICTIFYAKEAMEWADENGGITGDNIRLAFLQKKDWVPVGLEGVCSPATWTEDDYRSVVSMEIFEGHVNDGGQRWERLDTVDVGRDPKWLGR